MKKLFLLSLLLTVSFLQAQDVAAIDQLQNGSVTSIKTLLGNLVNLSNDRYEFYKEKETPEYLLLVYIPTGLNNDQKEELRVNRYENGFVFKLSKTDQGLYKVKEFFAKPDLMFAIVKSIFYPGASQSDFINNSKYRDYIDSSKKYKFYFYSGESENNKFRFYSY